MHLDSVIPPSTAVSIQEAVYTADVSVLQKRLGDFLLHTVSFYDTAGEAFYHGLVLGLCAMLDARYRISSNREAGQGRFDIQMRPLRPGLPGILIELKAEKHCTEGRLAQLAAAALEQMDERGYDAELRAEGSVEMILKYGIAFSGKMVHVEAAAERL